MQRFVRTDGSIGAHHPMRVIADDGRQLLGWLPSGTELLASRLTDGRNPRDVPASEMFVLPRVLVRSEWVGTSTMRLITEADWSSVWWFFDADLTFTGWYVNLEIPFGRTGLTTDRADGALDVVIHPDLTWEWKDEDEAAAAVEAGRLTVEQLTRLRAEGERQVGLARSASFPYDGTWCDFRPNPDWPAPTLPAELDCTDLDLDPPA